MDKVMEVLDSSKEEICEVVSAVLKNAQVKSSYTTVWRDFEELAIEVICKFLKNRIPKLTDDNFDYGSTGSEKNRLADLEIKDKTGSVFVSIKAARLGKNPQNDLGTLRQYPSKKKLYLASFELWVRYSDADGIAVDRVFFDRAYRFVGKSNLAKGGVIYRKKDGNMRPKSWQMFDSGDTCWATPEDFERAVEISRIYRANALVEEHLIDMNEQDQRALYEILKKKFEN